MNQEVTPKEGKSQLQNESTSANKIFGTNN
jgi:hypothetical protein